MTTCNKSFIHPVPCSEIVSCKLSTNVAITETIECDIDNGKEVTKNSCLLAWHHEVNSTFSACINGPMFNVSVKNTDIFHVMHTLSTILHRVHVMDPSF